MPTSRFADALARSFPALRALLGPPAPLDDLTTAARALGQALPAEVQAVYRTFDGQVGVLPGVLLGLRWLPLADALREHATWRDLAGDDPNLDSRPPGAIRPVTFSPSWFPFASDGAGNGLAVDLAPGSAGTPGQVITFGPDETTRLVLSPTLPAFLGWVADQIEAGHVTLEGDDVRLDGASSFLDRARSLF